MFGANFSVGASFFEFIMQKYQTITENYQPLKSIKKEISIKLELKLKVKPKKIKMERQTKKNYSAINR